MNIFILDYDIEKCAKYHVDKHVVKMPLELAQLVCATKIINGQTAPYKLTHKNHPCTIFTGKTLENYNYVCDLGLSLCREYTYRYGREHASQKVLEYSRQTPPPIPSSCLCDYALAMPDNCKVGDVVKSYRNYYIKEKANLFSWKKRAKPEWLEV